MRNIVQNYVETIERLHVVVLSRRNEVNKPLCAQSEGKVYPRGVAISNQSRFVDYLRQQGIALVSFKRTFSPDRSRWLQLICRQVPRLSILLFRMSFH